ncbi:MAG: adenylate/guanylate cyclase domain-containing protein, partial [Actinomycetota bacterium]
MASRTDAGSRRPVTIVFTDIVGSTALGERLDAESLGGLMTRYYETMRDAIERHGGAVEKFIGDAVVAAFGAPEVHEDDALRAVRAAHEMHAALDTLNAELERRWGTRLEVRTGIATGEVLAGGGAAVLGSPANLAARLQAEAGDGEILLSADTHRLVRNLVRAEPAGALELKGFESSVECFRLLGLDGEPQRGARTPHIGREHELALLELSYRRAMRDRRAQLVTVLGEPGMGKTRLVDEAIARLDGEPRVLRGRCLPYGEGITFFPVGEAVSAAAGIGREGDAERAQAMVAAMVPADAASVAARVSEAIGLGGAAGAPEETLWAIRRFFELLAIERSLVLVFDDLQWAEPTFLDLVAQLVERGKGVAELVVVVARPELLEQRPDWAGGAANAVTISLEPLTDDESAQLVRNVAARATLDDAAAARLAVAGGGNPLFLEEYVAMLVDDGVIIERDGRWHVPADVTVGASTPPTLIGLLTARLHRLSRHERDALVHASVIGKAFRADELASLSDEGSDLTDTLDQLLQGDLLVSAGRTGPDEGAFEFRHQLLRDAAYASLPKARRAELHERFAEHLEVAFPERPDELDEITGFHLAQAHDYRSELGAHDETTLALADRAAQRLSAAGGRAVERGDPRAATRSLQRAASLASQPGARAAIRLRLCHALGDAADTEGYEAALEAGLADAIAAGDERILIRFEHLKTTYALLSDPSAVPIQDMIDRLTSQAEKLEALDDAEGVAECHYQLATVAWIRGDATAFERWARRSRDDAMACGNARLVGRATSYVIVALLRGSTPLPQALAELRAMREATELSASAEANVRLGEAEMLAYLGRHDEARDLVDAAAAEFDELGARVDLAAAESVRAIVADVRGDLAGAERALRSSYERFRAMGDAATRAELWGGETRKAVANFPVSGEPIPPPVARWLGRIKAAA